MLKNSTHAEENFTVAVRRLTAYIKEATADTIADALRLKALNAARKYSPDQPRDDHGMWTDAGGRRNAPSAGTLPSVSPRAGTRENPAKPNAPHPLRTYPRNTNPSPVSHIVVHNQNNLTIHHTNGSTETRVGGTRTWRNNNPGNVIYDAGGFAKRHGALANNNGMAVFPDAATGHTANVALLKGPSYAQLTIDMAIKKRSPPQENNTHVLQQEISRRTGLSGSQRISELKPKEFDSLLEAIYQFEGWGEGTVMKTPPKSSKF